MSLMHMDPKHKLMQLKVAVEEIHSRRDDGFNDFGREEPAVGRLVRALDHILGQQTHDVGGAFQFLTAALQSVKVSSLVREPVARVETRNLALEEEKFRLWILFALSTPGAMMDTLREVLRMPDLIFGFFVESSPLNDPAFIELLLPIIASAFAHPLHGHVTYKLDISALSIFVAHDEIVAIRKRAATTTKKPAATSTAAGSASKVAQPAVVRRPVAVSSPVARSAPGSEAGEATQPTPAADSGSESVGPSSAPTTTRAAAEHDRAAATAPVDESDTLVLCDTPFATTFPPRAAASAPVYEADAPAHHHHHEPHTSKRTATPRRLAVATADGDTQTDPERPPTPPRAPTPPPRPVMISREVITDEMAPVPYAEIKRLEKMLIERDHINDETRRRLERQHEELEETREDLEDRLNDVTKTLRNLKALYNDHFMRVKEAQDAGKPVDRTRVDAALPQIVALLNGTAAPPAGLAAPPATTIPLQRGARDVEESDSDESTVMVQPGGSTFNVGAASSAESSPRGHLPMRTQSFASVSDSGAGSEAAAAGGGMRQRGMSIGVLATPNSAPIVAKGRRPWRTELLVEVERSVQLEQQKYKCATCGKDLPNPTKSNFFTKAVQRTQKPRRCHYSGALYCHDCHSNKKAALPFMVVQRWDFTEEHVSNADYDFLTERATKPLLHLPELPLEVQGRPVVQLAFALRVKLAKMFDFLHTCPDARTAFGSKLAHYYFLDPSYFSIADFVSLKNREVASEMGKPAGVVRLVLGHQGVDVIAALETLVAEARDHILVKCASGCRAAAVKRCTLCGDSDPVVMFEGGATCAGCRSPFHATCLGMGCPKCDGGRNV